MEVCRDTHPTLTYCLGLLGSQEPPILQSPGFGQLMESQKKKKSQAARCGHDTAGSVHWHSVSVTQPRRQEVFRVSDKEQEQPTALLPAAP